MSDESFKKTAVLLPSSIVRTLQELCEVAKIKGGVESFLRIMLESELREAARSRPEYPLGTVALILDGWDFDPDEFESVRERLCRIAKKRGGAQ